MSYDDEYYCPHCGAILNDQPGFDPDRGTWTCTECGEMLMDDDVYNGDSYEGVAWFCDNCGALLNRQEGFSDSYGSWTCTECGHINGTTEDDIINSLKCPSCGADLDVQSGFNKYDDDWECTECGAHLHHDYSDDEYEEVEEPKHRCPACGAALDNQWLFADYNDNWTCTECGAHLHHNYSSEEYKVIKHICPNCDEPLDIQWGFSEDDDDWECTECGAHLHHDYSDDEYEIVESEEDDEYEDIGDTEEENEENGGSEDEDRSGEYSSYSGSYMSGPSAPYYRSAPRESTSMYTTQRHSSKKSKHTVVALVLLLMVGILGYIGYDLFLNDDKPEKHPGEIKITYSASSYKKENYYDAIIKLNKQGLSDIRVTPLNDLKTGILTKEGRIETIEINGISDFRSGTWIDEDSVVSITYHSFAKKEKQGYDIKKNNHLILNEVDIALPDYLIEDSQDATSAYYHVKGDEETTLIILFDNYLSWNGIDQFDTSFVLGHPQNASETDDKTIVALAKKDDVVYSIRETTLKTDAGSTYLHLIQVTEDGNRTSYSDDYAEIVAGIYFPDESEIRIDFVSKDYKGENYEDVVAVLKSKGFTDVQAENLQDIVVGIFAKEGTVEDISINGSTDYKTGDWIDEQAQIVVTYHGRK